MGERRSGSLRMFFGLSFDRDDVFFGKLASRLGVIGVATFVTSLVAGAMSLILFGSIPVPTFLGFTGLTVLFGAMFTSIAVSVSAMAASRMQAMAGAIGSYVLFVMLWHPIVGGIYYALNGELVGYEAPTWYLIALRLNPLEAYNRGISILIDQYLYGLIGWESIVEDIPPQKMRDGGLMVSERLGGELPFYLTEWVSPIILLAWIAVPIYIGYRRFERADLN
ncbi:MAG: ABC transporter permease subunit [Halobacteriaceae archaeon]